MAIGARDTSSRDGILGLGARTVITRGDDKLGRQDEAPSRTWGSSFTHPWDRSTSLLRR
jgi:hypothetical protein